MTNNPTIDGVSRATIEKGFDVIVGFFIPTIKVSLPPCQVDDDESWNSRDAISKNIKALLDADIPASVAPAIERQPVDSEQWWADTPDGEPALVTRVGALTEWQRGRDGMREERDAAQTEVAALQSTIAQLQARIAELESGRGEPFTHMRIDVDGNPYRCRAEDHGDSFPVYRAPPAPVAVVLPQVFEKAVRDAWFSGCGYGEREHLAGHSAGYQRESGEAYVKRACLDATTSLNVVQK